MFPARFQVTMVLLGRNGGLESDGPVAHIGVANNNRCVNYGPALGTSIPMYFGILIGVTKQQPLEHGRRHEQTAQASRIGYAPMNRRIGVVTWVSTFDRWHGTSYKCRCVNKRALSFRPLRFGRLAKHQQQLARPFGALRHVYGH